MIVTHKIDMDLLSKNENAAVPQIHAVQGDCNSRRLMLSMRVGQELWLVPQDVTVQMRYRKPDGTGGIYDTLPNGIQAWSVQDNLVLVTLAPQILTVAGVVRSQVVLQQKGSLVATFEVQIIVQEDPSVGTLKSEDYTNLRMWMTEQVEDALSKAKLTGAFDGATFVPKVSSAGILSWTNDKGLTNPESVNINAPQGILPMENGGTGAATAAEARANLGAAAAGYGWGETQTSYNPPYADPDNVDRTCVFSCSQGSIPRGGIWRGVAHFQNADNGQMVVRSYTNGEGVVARRYKISGEWKPWEYENPWMTPGTEYRTTELWNGKPVYIKVINYGKLAAANTNVTISLGCTATNLIEFDILTTLSSGTQYNFPAFNLNTATAMLTGYFNEAKTALVVRCHQDLSSATAIVTVKYTKA